MKKIILLLACLVTANAFAVPSVPVNQNSSWEDILYTPNIHADFHRVWMEGWYIPITNLCVDGTSFRTITPVTDCVEFADEQHLDTCLRYGSKHLVAPITDIQRGCIEWDYPHETCMEYGEVVNERALVYDVEVFDWAGDDNSYNFPLFTKQWIISACEDKGKYQQEQQVPVQEQEKVVPAPKYEQDQAAPVQEQEKVVPAPKYEQDQAAPVQEQEQVVPAPKYDQDQAA